MVSFAIKKRGEEEVRRISGNIQSPYLPCYGWTKNREEERGKEKKKKGGCPV